MCDFLTGKRIAAPGPILMRRFAENMRIRTIPQGKADSSDDISDYIQIITAFRDFGKRDGRFRRKAFGRA